MALDPRLSLTGVAPDFQSGANALAQGIINRKPTQLRNQLLDYQVQGEKQRLTQDQANFQLTDMATDAIQLKSMIESGATPEQVNAFFQYRDKKITDRDGDPSHTRQTQALYNSGNMDAFMAELDAPIQAATQLGLVKPGIGDMPEELKVGRFRQITLPDGSIASLDTATNSVTPIAEAQSLDLSSVPEDMRESVANQPREVQQKIVEAYTSPSGREKELKSKEQQAKAQEVTNKTKSLVSELLNNISGVKAVTGGLDEMTPTFLPGSKDAEAALEDLRNLLTVENLDLMSGVLSESDIKILKSVGASGLSGSQERVIKTLQDMGSALGVGQSGGQVGRFKVRVK